MPHGSKKKCICGNQQFKALQMRFHQLNHPSKGYYELDGDRIQKDEAKNFVFSRVCVHLGATGEKKPNAKYMYISRHHYTAQAYAYIASQTHLRGPLILYPSSMIADVYK